MMSNVLDKDTLLPLPRTLLTVHKDKEGILRHKSSNVETLDQYILDLIKDMESYANDHPLLGLSAPQLGVSVRVSLLWEKGRHLILINPVVTKQSDQTHELREGCLSLPGQFYWLRRPKIVKVRFLSIDGNESTVKGRDLTAQILCHEIDHLDGLLIDRGRRIQS